ncbi:MAG: FAD-dependent oxidoreductase [Pseudomonadaceae bacterium]|nr:FAD-dependent oxidoreductase [Pseudomonadaceae bacterium]
MMSETGRHEETATVAVVGAGLSGLTCASQLVEAGHAVAVFDKSGDIGGRLATRRRPPLRWNHGAPYVQARSESFRAFMKQQQSSGFARAVRLPRGELGFRGSPDMRELLRGVSDSLSINTHTRVTRLRRGAGGWLLRSEEQEIEHGPYAQVVLALPAPQVLALLLASNEVAEDSMIEQLSQVRMVSNWALLLSFEEEVPLLDRLPLDYVVESITREDNGLAYVVRFGSQWSSERIDIERDDMAPILMHTLASRAGEGEKLPKPATVSAHRWRFAESSQPLGEYCLWQPETGLGACGDWCLGAYAEHAFLSGKAMAQAICGEPT